MEKKQSKEIDLENITLEELKEEYKRLSAENAELKKDLESVKGSKEFYQEQQEYYYKQTLDLKGTLRSIIKLAQSELK